MPQSPLKPDKSWPSSRGAYVILIRLRRSMWSALVTRCYPQAYTDIVAARAVLVAWARASPGITAQRNPAIGMLTT